MDGGTDADAGGARTGEGPGATGPAPVLLLVLVAGLSVLMAGLFLWSPGSDGTVRLGPLTELAERAGAGPVAIAALPHLVVTRSTAAEPVFEAAYGEDDGSVMLDPYDRLVVLALDDPVDGATLVWCRTSGLFEHPTTDRAYAVDGRLVRGDGRRGMDRRAVGVVGGGEVEVDDDRWVSGPPRDEAVASFTPRGPSCSGG